MGTSAGVFSETVIARRGAASSQAEVYVPNTGGPYTFTEQPMAYHGGRGGVSVDQLFALAPGGGGIGAGGIDGGGAGVGGIFTEVVAVRVGIFTQVPPASNITNEETVTARIGRSALSLDAGIWPESLTATHGARTQQTEIYIVFPGGNIYFESPIARHAGRAVLALQQIVIDSPAARHGRRGVASPQLITADTPAVRHAARGAVADSRIYPNDSVSARHGGRGSGLTRGITIDVPVVRHGGKGQNSLQQIVTDSPSARAGRRPTAVNPVVWLDTAIVRHGGRASGTPIAITIDTASVQAGAKGLAVAPATILDAPRAHLGFHSSMLEGRAYVELVAARRGRRAAGTTSMMVMVETVSVRSGSRSHTAQTIDPNGLIPAIRANIRKALPALTQIPEALPDEETARMMQRPYAVILAHEPSPLQFAVNDQAVLVPVDILLVYDEAVAIDNPQLMRADLHLVSDQMLRDYQQFGDSGEPSAIGTERVATPHERANAYEKHYRSINQPVAVHVLSMEHVVVESLVGA